MLESRIGRPVRYKPPRDAARRGKKGKTGTIIDETWANPKLHTARRHGRNCRHRKTQTGCWGDYSFCAQLIKWDHGEHSIRLSYYRRRCGEDKWEYASQMTVDSYWPTIKKLLKITLTQSEWFKDVPQITPTFKATGRRGDWFADVDGENVPCAWNWWLKGKDHYFDPEAKPGTGKWVKYIDVLKRLKKVALTGKKEKNGKWERDGYIALFEVANIVTTDGTIEFDLVRRLANLK